MRMLVERYDGNEVFDTDTEYGAARWKQLLPDRAMAMRVLVSLHDNGVYVLQRDETQPITERWSRLERA